MSIREGNRTPDLTVVGLKDVEERQRDLTALLLALMSSPEGNSSLEPGLLLQGPDL
jgi:hypothetical protein